MCPGFLQAFNDTLFNFNFLTTLFCPPILWFWKKFFLPLPGQGPDLKSRLAGFLRIHGYGTGSKGSRFKATLYFPKDPGY